jgi:branched-chain amino acid transport system substrate-binding protein
VALVAALVKTQGAQRFSTQILTNASGFAGIDGVFRFRPDGTNERGLAVLRVTPNGGQVVSPAPRTFKPGT